MKNWIKAIEIILGAICFFGGFALLCFYSLFYAGIFVFCLLGIFSVIVIKLVLDEIDDYNDRYGRR